MGKTTPFSARQRIRRWKFLSGTFHLASVASFVFCILWALPLVASKSELQLGQEWKERQEGRQLLVEALDRLVRYQHYFHDMQGRFTRDLSRLSVPARLAGGDLEQLRRRYEISVVEVQPKRFLLLATGVSNGDRLTVDESHRMNANFTLPPPSRAYLIEEADRTLGLLAAGATPPAGVYSDYWRLSRSPEDQQWVAVGLRHPVAGERRDFQGERALASIFAAVSERVKSKMGVPSAAAALGGAITSTMAEPDFDLEAAAKSGPFKEALAPADVQEWLESARLAQHVHRREHGRYARKWEQLDGVSGYHFAERMKAARNVRVHPIELSADEKDFRLTLEGTSGDLMGEQFVMDRSGAMRQVRYTETLINQLQEGTSLLENTLHFQINPIVDDPVARPGYSDRP